MYKYPVAKPTSNTKTESLVIKTMMEGWLSSQAPIIKEDVEFISKK